MDELPIYSDAIRRGPDPFADLKNLEGADLTTCWERFDRLIDFAESASDINHARELSTAPTKEVLLKMHKVMFSGRDSAGALRHSVTTAMFRGQDCPEPEFVDRSLDNFERWLTADSFMEIHAVEKAALVLTRLIDIWPFEFGNRTTAVVFSNHFLAEARLPPFFILAEKIEEFDRVLEQAITMQTQPLVTAMYESMRRELNLVGR